VLDGLEGEFLEATLDAAADSVTEFADLINFGFCCGLQGNEIIKVDVAGFLRYLGV
jgi:hypothetical protein